MKDFPVVTIPKANWLNGYTYGSQRAVPAGSRRIAINLPYNAQYVPYIKLSDAAPAGQRIQMESETYAGGNQVCDYITKAGAQEYMPRNWINGDYALFDIPNAITDDMILALGYRETGFPITAGTNTDFIGYFNSVIDPTDSSNGLFTGGHTWTAGQVSLDNNFYDELWKKSVRTLYLTIRDGFMDCPDRERGQYVGDAVNEFLEAYYSLGPETYPVIKKLYNENFGWQYQTSVGGRTYYPTSDVRPGKLGQEIAPQTFALINSLRDFYKFTGDSQCVEQVWQKMYNYLTNWDLETSGAYAGTLAARPQNTYVASSSYGEWCDWGNNMDVRTTFNIWYYMAASTLADLAAQIPGVSMTPAQSDFLNTRITSIKDNFQKEFWRDDVQAYGTPYSSTASWFGWRSTSTLANGTNNCDDRVNALAVVSGLCPPDKYQDVRDLLMGGTALHPYPYENASIYMEKYVQEALFKMGYPDDAMKRMVKRHINIVNDAVDSTMPEQWSWTIGGSGGNTKNHGWSGGSMVAMSRDAAGVEPTSTAWDTWHVVPQMGTFDQINCNVPAIIGNINVNIEKDTSLDELYMTVVSPGKDAQFWVPQEDGQVVKQLSGPAAQYIGDMEQFGETYAVFEASAAGTYSFKAGLDDSGQYAYITFTNATPAIDALISVNGADPIPLPKRIRVTTGDNVTITATPADAAENAFVSWSGDVASTNSTISFKADTDKNLTLTMKALYQYATITLSQAGTYLATDARLSVNGADPQAFPGSLKVRIGQQYTLKAVAADPSQYNVTGWSGDITTSGDTLTFVPRSDMYLTANFKSIIDYYNVTFTTSGIPLNSFANAPDVTISVNGSAPVKLSSTTQRLRGDTQYTVEIKAANNVDFSFSDWSGGLVSINDPITFTPSKDMTLTANFKRNGYNSISYASAGASVITSGQANTTTWKSANLINGNIVPNNPIANSLGWSSASLGSQNPTGSHWAAIDLGAQKSFNRFQLYPRMDTFTSAGGTCYFPTDFTLEYSTDDVAATTAAQLATLNWQTVPGGTGAGGDFVVAAADVPFMKPYVIQLAAPITARYVRITCHQVNAMASDTTTNWYWQMLSFGIYDTSNIPQQYTVSFDSQGGSAVAPVIVNGGGAAARPADPTKEGYVFAGWQLNGADYDFNSPVNANITITAVWTPVTYTVTFDAGGGAPAPAPQTVAYGGTAAKPADPARAGFTFTGWYTDAAAAVPYNWTAAVTGSFTLFAGWSSAPVPPDSITMSAAQTSLNMKVGAKLQLQITVSPVGADPRVTWSSSNPAVATVDPVTGQVTALKTGSVRITVKSNANPAASYMFLVMINA